MNLLIFVTDNFIKKPEGIFCVLDHAYSLLLTGYFMQAVQDLKQVCDTLLWYVNVYAREYKVVLRLLMYQ